MSKKPQYPIEQGKDVAPEKPVEFKFTPADLYSIPSFKFAHEVRAPLEKARHRIGVRTRNFMRHCRGEV